jgi:copper homeostasis protein (lipoprotein)
VVASVIARVRLAVACVPRLLAGRLFLTGVTLLGIAACANQGRVDAGVEVPTGTVPGRLAGMYGYFADAGIFTDCSTGNSYPVAQEADNLALERAYLATRGDPGEPLMVIVEGRIASRPAMEGGGEEESLVVARFVELRPGERCDMSIMHARLAGSGWMLAELQGQEVPDKPVPYLHFDPSEPRITGFTGCNKLTGGYALGEDRLTFSTLATTRKYCAATAKLEQAFLGALAQTRQARVTGERLALLDDAGRALARFRTAE